MGGGLFVPHVDDFDAFVETPVVDAHDMTTGQREDTLHSRRLERLCYELAAVGRCIGHIETPRGVSCPRQRRRIQVGRARSVCSDRP